MRLIDADMPILIDMLRIYGLWLDAEYDDFFHKGLERAARIVKRGGVDA